MCQQCNCAFFIEQGPKAVLERAVTVINEMRITAENAQSFEDGERICGIIASRLSNDADDEIREIAEYVSGLHQNVYGERSRAYVRAAREVFANFPAKGSPREVMTTWHQLEQLCRELGADAISSVEDAAVRDAILAVQHVHDGPQQRRAELLRRYHLEDL